MWRIFRRNLCVIFTLLSLTLFAIASFSFSFTHGLNGLYYLCSLLPSSSSSSSPWTSSINGTSSSPSVPPCTNPKTALYPTFTNPKMQRAVEKMVKDLEAETLRRRGRKRDKKMERIEAGLAKARGFIKSAMANSSSMKHSFSSTLSGDDDDDYVPHGDIYRDAYAFHRSYLVMENLFKIFVYEEGQPPLFHYGPMKNIYSMEGIFLNLMEKNTKFRTFNPNQAHVYFLPYSVVMILEYLFDPIIRDKAVLGRVIGDYVQTISTKYPFWNRSLGADHFMLSCHDWGPRSTWYVHQLYFTSIRVLCNANTSEFFNPRKDVSFPEINLRTGNITELTGGYPYPNRTVLAFFAGALHGRLRPALFQHWKDKDDDIKVYQKVPEGVNYDEMMKRSKFCICPSGHEVASPRIVEAIYAECVPVLISQHYVLPFSDVLDWAGFSVQVSVDDLPELKKILMEISEEKYRRMQERVKQVQRHFVVNDPPQRYDVFHMILHSIWLRRLNLRINS